MGVEQLNASGAWRLIVARLGGIHNLPAHLTILTNRHRAKPAQTTSRPVKGRRSALNNTKGGRRASNSNSLIDNPLPSHPHPPAFATSQWP
jgi:hypothetical protein